MRRTDATTDCAALLRAVEQCPEDVSAVLVLADALQERGWNETAAWIRGNGPWLNWGFRLGGGGYGDGGDHQEPEVIASGLNETDARYVVFGRGLLAALAVLVERHAAGTLTAAEWWKAETALAQFKGGT